MSTTPHAEPARRTRLRRPPARRLAALAGVWVALTGGALVLANAMDDPVGAGERDAAQPAVPGAISEAPAGGGADAAADPAPAGPAAPAAPSSPNAVPLPPFAMVLDHRLPADVAGLPPAEQAEALRQMAMTTKDPVRLVELGSVMQVLGDAESARFAYRSALEADPGSVAARVGLAVAPATGNTPEGLAEAAAALEPLAREQPRDQLVLFNLGWVELYRGRTDAARAALQRVEAAGAGTRLGRTAGTLLAAMGTVTFEVTP